MLIQYNTIIYKGKCNEGKKTNLVAQESRCVVKIGAKDLCIAHSGASSLKSEVDSDRDPGDDDGYVTAEYI